MGYDLRGNLTSSGSSAYTYNRLNQLTSGPGTTLTYDPAGRLSQFVAASGTARFGYAGSAMIQEVGTSGTILRRYVPGPGVDEPVVWYEGSATADRRWLHADERGSVVAVSDGSGAMLAINRYDEYGVPQSGNAGRFQYTGQAWLPELGMYYYKARMYSATLGRFMQTDPIGYGAGMNWYNYVGGDPVNFTDPMGLAVDQIVNGIVYRLTCVGSGDGPLQCSWEAIGYAYSPNNVDASGLGQLGLPLPTDIFGDPLPIPPDDDFCRGLRDEANRSKSDLPSGVTDSRNWNSIQRLRYDWAEAYTSQQESHLVMAGFGALGGGSALVPHPAGKVGAAASSGIVGAATINEQWQGKIMKAIEARIRYIHAVNAGKCPDL